MHLPFLHTLSCRMRLKRRVSRFLSGACCLLVGAALRFTHRGLTRKSANLVSGLRGWLIG